MSEVKAYLVPFSHMDLFWLGAQEECLSRGNRIIAEVMELAANHPEFRFLLEDLVFVDHFLRCHPEKKPEIRDLLKRGQIEVGPKWAGIDQTPQLGEDLVRNSLYSMDYLERELGYVPKTMHTGDLPGWTPQYPQILEKLGIPYAVYTRIGPTDVSLFYWVGLDGTRRLVWHSLKGYGWAWHAGLEVSVDKAMESGLEQSMKEVLAQGAEPIFVHWGVDLILPGKKLPENLKEWNRRSEVKMAFATPTEYFQNVATGGLREVGGEVPSAWPYSEPQYPIHMLLTFPAVTGLLTAEHYSALAWRRGYLADYPADRIREEWLLVLEVMDHNNNGQGYDQTRLRKRDYLQSTVTASTRIREDALHRIVERVESKFGSEANPIVVFNPLSWGRTEPIEVHVTYHGNISAFDIARHRTVHLVDEQGKEVAFQPRDTREGVSREEYLQFLARDVPACGYRTYYVVPGAGSLPMGSFVRTEGSGYQFVTPFYRISVTEETGEMSVQDAATGRQIVNGMRIVGTEELLSNGGFRDRTSGRSLEALVESIRLVETGPVSATIEIRASVAGNSVVQRVAFYRESRRIDIVNDVDFREWHPMRLEQVFATGMSAAEASYGVAYGASWMGNMMPNAAPFRNDEMPRESWEKLRNCIHWLDLGGGEGGLTIGSRHRCFRIEAGTARAVMIRGVVSSQCVYIRDGKRVRHERPYPGSHRFQYCLLPHTADWRSSKSYRCGWELNFALQPVFVADTSSAKQLPPSQRFLELEGDTDSLVLDVVKKAEQGEALVVRFHETEGKPGSARVALPGEKPRRIAVCDLHEKPRSEVAAGARIGYRAYEIVTLRIER